MKYHQRKIPLHISFDKKKIDLTVTYQLQHAMIRDTCKKLMERSKKLLKRMCSNYTANEIKGNGSRKHSGIITNTIKLFYYPTSHCNDAHSFLYNRVSSSLLQF